MHRASQAIAYGAAVADATLFPGVEYYLNVTDSESEAVMMKAQQDARRSSG